MLAFCIERSYPLHLLYEKLTVLWPCHSLLSRSAGKPLHKAHLRQAVGSNEPDSLFV